MWWIHILVNISDQKQIPIFKSSDKSTLINVLQLPRPDCMERKKSSCLLRFLTGEMNKDTVYLATENYVKLTTQVPLWLGKTEIKTNHTAVLYGVTVSKCQGFHIVNRPAYFSVCCCNTSVIQSVPFKTQPSNNHVLRHNQKQVHHRVIDSPNLPRDSRVKITPVARPLLTPVAKKLRRCEHGVFTSRTCVHSRNHLLLFVKHLAMRILTRKHWIRQQNTDW
jgi:hypothetical protein